MTSAISLLFGRIILTMPFLCTLSLLLVSGCASAVRYSSDSSAWRQSAESVAENKSKTENNRQKQLFPQTDGPLSPLQKNLVEKAQQFLGMSYCYGGNGQQCVDCSGFTVQVFGSCGVVLPRTAQQQSYVGRAIAPSEASAGDLFFFSFDNRAIDHVGMYIGNGSIIHASKSKGVVLQRLELSGLLNGLRSIRRVTDAM
ncbi:MAG: C40 family peptidase [Bacteroidetes bacterium]|nr:C40 family peptidase [Bacteroidota bacterium]